MSNFVSAEVGTLWRFPAEFKMLVTKFNASALLWFKKPKQVRIAGKEVKHFIEIHNCRVVMKLGCISQGNSQGKDFMYDKILVVNHNGECKVGWSNRVNNERLVPYTEC